MSAAARELLGLLLDRLERQPERKRRVMECPPPFAGIDERAAFEEVVKEAERHGAVELEMGRGEAGHLIGHVVLADADSLYRFLHRRTSNELANEAAAALRATFPDASPHIAELIGEFRVQWCRQGRPYGLGPESAGASRFLRALDAVLRRDAGDRSDLRTLSRRSTGDSKLLEGQLKNILLWHRRNERLPEGLSDEDALAHLGLEKFPQPVLMGGPVDVGGAPIAHLPYAGLPPEAVDIIRPADAVRSVLFIENLASFNRHVREARQPGDLVVYTGGFPSRTVLQALRRAAAWKPDAVFHWGDIDAGGLRIALHIQQSIGTPLRLHLMSEALARSHGTPAAPVLIPTGLLSDDIAALGRFLASDDARHLEQEQLDPVPVPSDAA